jgi:lipopolysaccharide transport system permease protein
MRSINSTINIKPNISNKLSISELWLYRELFYFFAWRDIKVRYKQTAIGAGWAVLQPLIVTIIFTFIFNRIVGIKSGGIPYPVFAYLGLMYWNMFSGALTNISNSLVNSQAVITKIYFPRLIPPLSSALVSIVDFVFAALVFLGLLVFFKVMPDLIFGPIACLAALILISAFAIGFGTFLASVNVKYRDVRTALPFLIQVMMYASPVIYPIEIIPEQYRTLAYLNPAAGAVSLARAGLFGTEMSWMGLSISILVTVFFIALGLWYFKRSEKDFADIV